MVGAAPRFHDPVLRVAVNARREGLADRAVSHSEIGLRGVPCLGIASGHCRGIEEGEERGVRFDGRDHFEEEFRRVGEGAVRCEDALGRVVAIVAAI